MRRWGQYRRLSADQRERLSEQTEEQLQQHEAFQAELARKGDELRAVLEREARLKAESYALLEAVNALMEHLEDGGAGARASSSSGS